MFRILLHMMDMEVMFVHILINFERMEDNLKKIHKAILIKFLLFRRKWGRRENIEFYCCN